MKNQHLTLMQRIFVEIDDNEGWYKFDTYLIPAFAQALSEEMQINDTFQSEAGVVYKLHCTSHGVYRVIRTRRIEWGEAMSEFPLHEARKLGYVVEGK